MKSVEDLVTTGSPVAKFPTIGTTVKGTIVGIVVQQATDMEGKPKLTKAGKEMTDWVITLDTDEREATIEGDDGQRRIFAGWRMQMAIKDAFRQAKATGSFVGGTLAVQYKEDGEKFPGLNPAKVYVAQYKAPAAPSVSVDELI